jgi:hypothetical protein
LRLMDKGEVALMAFFAIDDSSSLSIEPQGAAARLRTERRPTG